MIQNLYYPALLLGSIWIAQLVYRIFAYIFRQCIRPKLLHPKNRQAVVYNQNGGAWAVITGGTDGIGEGMAKNLVKQGFNICIVSRNIDKINKKLDEMKGYAKNAGKQIETMGVKCDFSEVTTIQEYQSIVVDKIKDLDVAILILNAGIGQVGSMLKMEDSYIQNLCNVNVLHVMYLTKLMVSQLSGRLAKKGQRSAVIITSSISANLPFAGFTAYGATKYFETYIAESCFYEFEDSIDFLSFRPSFVESAINKRNPNGGNRDMITSDEAAAACFEQLGYTEWTQGHWTHEITGLVFSLVPRPQLNRAIFPEMKQLQATLGIKEEEEAKKSK